MKEKSRKEDSMQNPPFVNLFYRTIRITTFILLFCSFCSFAGNANSQAAKITIKKNNVALIDVLNEIENQTNYLFIYSNDINVKRSVSINVNKASLIKILTDLFQKEGVKFELEGRHIVLKKSNIREANRSLQANKDEKITGRVVDSKGEPIIGASVSIKGTKYGTVTDLEGNFQLNASSKQILEVSFIGYKSQEIVVGNERILKIVLEEDTKILDEVVVVGYGVQTKANLTGAVAQVTSKALENKPITNIGQGLQGVIPNLNISVSGAPGAGSSFNIRGTTSLNGGSPLVLVDNVQMDANLVNPDDIESISVLKDASSSAIYGARAAYGVILITTKAGKKSKKPVISFSANGYWQRPAISVTNIGSMDFLKMKDIAFQNSGGSGHYYNPKVYEMAEKYANGTYPYTEFYDVNIDKNKWIYCGNTNWFKEMYRTSFSQQYNSSISGGTDKTTYYASFGFANQQGILKSMNDKYHKYNTVINLTSKITEWLEVSAKAMNTYTKEKHPAAAAGLSDYGGQLTRDLSPLMPIYHSHKGRLFYVKGAPAINQDDIVTAGDYIYTDENTNYSSGQGGYTNPFAVSAYAGSSKYKRSDTWLTGAIKLTPLEGLVINADYTFNIYNRGVQNSQKQFIEYTAVDGTENFYPWTKPSKAYYNNSEDYYNSLNVFAEYSKSFMGKTHNFKIMGGYNQEYKHSKFFYAETTNLIDQNTPSLGMGAGDKSINSSESHWGVNGYFARFNYNYKQRYLVEFNGRYDGSSKFPKESRYAFFPSASAGWRISEESFWSPIKEWWGNMKIRGSYGLLGNQAVSGNFPYLLSYGTNANYGYIIDGKKLVTVSAPGLVSNKLTWETVIQMDLGFDATFLNDRLSASFDYYRRDTKDMLVGGMAVPSVLGTNVPLENSANLKTTGWELALSWNDKLSNGLSYWVKGVLSDYQSEITKFDNNPKGLLNQYYVGRKIGEIWGYKSNGLFQTNEEVSNSPNQIKLWNGKWAAGDVKYVDIDGNKSIDWGNNTLENHGDLSIIGNNSPRYQYGITAGFEYFGFDFEMFWQGIGKRDAMLSGPQFWGFDSEWNTPYTPALDYWTEENRNAYFPRPSWANGGNRQTSTRYLQNASYVRLKNVTLGYTIPEKILRKINISRLRVYLVGENLFTFTNMIKSFDPETMNNSTYPINRKIALGLNLTF